MFPTFLTLNFISYFKNKTLEFQQLYLIVRIKNENPKAIIALTYILMLKSIKCII